MADSIQRLADNLEDVTSLLDIHEQKTGGAPGRRFGVEALNKSGIVLAVACWEAYVEDCATEAFEFVLALASEPSKLPESVRKLVAKAIKSDQNELSPWKMAGTGWQQLLADHRDATVKKYVSPLNTPKFGNVDGLFLDLLGLADVSAAWSWHRMPVKTARERLASIITMRGAIAHRVSPDHAVHKKDVEDAVAFIQTIANLTSNRVRLHVHGLTGSYLWPIRPEPGKPGRAKKAVASVAHAL